MEIQALLFDLGKVLIDLDFALGIDRLASRCDLPRDRFEAVLRDNSWNRRYECGAISTAEYHRHLCDHGGLRMELDEFHDSWASILLPGMILPERLLASLKRRYPLILVSNTNECHAEYVAKNYPVFDYFEAKIFSHEVGAMKPEAAIYEAAIAASGRPPEALFFIDDREENVAGARQIGIRAHQFTCLDGLISAFREHGVEVGEF